MSTSRRLHYTYTLAALTLLAAIVPQRGDPGSDPLTHPEWARMMLRGLDLEESLDYVTSASRAFSALSWRQSDWLQAGEFIPGSAQGVQLEPGAPAFLRASADLGEVSFPVTVVRPGEYTFRVHMAGPPDRPATVEFVPLGNGAARSCTLAPGPVSGWIEAPNPMRLHPGAYRATFALPQGATLQTLELAPRCIAPVEPLGGWQLNDTLDAEDLAVTLLRALDRERELAPADTPMDVEGSEFSTGEAGGEPSARLVGGTGGTRATVVVEVPSDGLYSLAAFGVRRAGQRWAADDCRTATSCPRPERLPMWSPVMTLALSAGRHQFSVELGPGDSVDRLRLERRQDQGPDYVDALQRMGFDPGTGLVSREKAREALDWLEKRHRMELSEACWEFGSPLLDLPPPVQVAVVPPPLGGGGGIEPPPTLPCQPPSSPTVPDPCEQ